MTTIISKDPLRASVEAASGGLVTVLYDAKGHPNIMRRFPKVKIEDLFPDLGLSGTFPAFIVNGEIKSELFISVFPNSIVDNVGVSLPGQDPAINVSYQEAMNYCYNKGPGYHLMTNVEWALLQGLALQNDFQPRGNTNWGQNHEFKFETGTLVWSAIALGENGRTLAGSGPLSWRHDRSVAGLSDLVGNVWEMVAGLRIMHGEINIIPDNDAAAHNADHSTTSPLWKAILQNGSLVDPGITGTVRYNVSGSTGEGSVVVDTVCKDTSRTIVCAFEDIRIRSGLTVPSLVKLLGLFPVDKKEPVGTIWLNNYDERFPMRGGSYLNGSGCGLFALNLTVDTYYKSGNVGFRSAFIK